VTSILLKQYLLELDLQLSSSDVQIFIGLQTFANCLLQYHMRSLAMTMSDVALSPQY